MTSPQKRTAQIAQGREVYLASYCGTCHASSAAGTAGMFGPSHDHLAQTVLTRLQSGVYTGQATTVSSYLRESILEPEAYEDPAYAGSRYRMPAFTDLSETELNDLVMFLEQP